MEWSDLVHLALFNMTAYKPQKYYDVDINILPYLDNHWTSMYLPPKVCFIFHSKYCIPQVYSVIDILTILIIIELSNHFTIFNFK